MAREPIDTVQPWTIKAVPTATRDAVTKAARREGLTVGQWLEKRVAEWEGDGSPVPVAQQQAPGAPDRERRLREAAELAAMVAAGAANMPKNLAAALFAEIRTDVRQIRQGRQPDRAATRALPSPKGTGHPELQTEADE